MPATSTLAVILLIGPNDGECDDPRFGGSGMAATLLAKDTARDTAKDTDDCRSLYQAGRIYLR